MRILHWYPNFLLGGGVAKAVCGLAAAQARLGVEVAIAAAQDAAAPPPSPSAEGPVPAVIAWHSRRTFRSGGLAWRWISRDAVRRLREFNPDVVHVHGGLNPDHLWIPRIVDATMVLSPHGTYSSEVFRKTRRQIKRLYFGIERRWLLSHVCAFHALSTGEGEQIQRMVPGARVYCVPQGAGMLLLPARADQKARGPVRFVFVGRLDVFTKGLDILLEAFARVRAHLGKDQTILTLIGPDWRGGLAWLQRLGAVLGITGSVEFSGPLSDPAVALALQQSDIYIQLSRHDAFPLSVAEALLAGKPALLSQAVGTASYREVESLPHVRIVPPRVQPAADAMIDMFHGLDALRAQAGQCAARVQHFFSWDRVARVQLERYAQFQRDGRPPGGEMDCPAVGAGNGS